MRLLPPLVALHSFEAAARHGSFTEAARELRVTQSAISHQVKRLETELGVRLFERLPRELRLTAAGKRLAAWSGEAFDLLARSVKAVRKPARPVLSVTVLPSFAVHWLVPRLPAFHAAHPEIQLRLDASLRALNLQKGEADLAIRYGRRHPGLRARRLFGEELFPVCSPRLSLRAAADLRRHILLHDEPTEAHGGWAEWLEAAKVTGVPAARGPVFTDTNLLLQAALAGQGVALGRSVLVAGELAAGRLVRPFSVSIWSRFHYALVMPKRNERRDEVRAFREFLEQQIAA